MFFKEFKLKENQGLRRTCAIQYIYIYIYLFLYIYIKIDIYSDLGGLEFGVLQAFSYIWARGVQPARVCAHASARSCLYFLFGSRVFLYRLYIRTVRFGPALCILFVWMLCLFLYCLFGNGHCNFVSHCGDYSPALPHSVENADTPAVPMNVLARLRADVFMCVQPACSHVCACGGCVRVCACVHAYFGMYTAG